MSPTSSLPGLTTAEVADRVARGEINRVRRSDAAEYRDIVWRNVVTLFNGLVVPAAIVLLLLRDYKAGFAISGFAIVNTLVGLVQEIRAKWQLDRLMILSEGRVRVLRDAQVCEILAGDVVRDDLLLLKAGDSVVADGLVVEARFLEIDEALLTGESDPVPRKPGEELLSGSFCVTGEGSYQAVRVGTEAFAQKTAAEARSYQYTASPLQREIDWLIRLLTAVAVGLSLCYLALYYARRGSANPLTADELARMVAATITSMVPQGLVLMATIALLLGAVYLTSRGAVVNRLSAVEAMASIDTLCMDKTGTLTTNQLRLERIEPLVSDPPEVDIRLLLSLFACCSLDRDSKSLIALRTALGETKGEMLDQLPFKSQNRFSALRARLSDREVVLALGAVEALSPFLVSPVREQAAWQRLSTSGLRLLLFCEAVERPSRTNFDGKLDGHRLRALALLALGDDLRPEAADVLTQLAEQGISFKILSGDNPETVRATVAPLAGKGAPPALAELAAAPVVTGSELQESAGANELILTRSVFGRVSPWQKVQIVRTLKGTGRQVAMIGDGVNDVLPIKNANLGIAMGDGSGAARTVAGVVLKTNDFSLVPGLLDEARVIVRNLRRSGKLFLNKNVYFLVMIIGTIGIFDLPFPLAPQQVTLLNFLTIGIPALLITLDRRKAPAARGEYVREVAGFAFSTGLITGATALGLMLVADRSLHEGVAMQRTMVLSTLVLLGWSSLWRALGTSRAESSREDRWLRLLPLPGLGLYLLVMYVPVPFVPGFFEMEPMNLLHWAWSAGLAGLGGVGACLWDRATRPSA